MLIKSECLSQEQKDLLVLCIVSMQLSEQILIYAKFYTNHMCLLK